MSEENLPSENSKKEILNSKLEEVTGVKIGYIFLLPDK